MIDLLILLSLAAVLTWAVLDIYSYSILTESLRQYSEKWGESRGLLRYFRYALGCPHCLSHWVAAVILAAVIGLGYIGALPTVVHPALVVLFLPAVARVALVLRDYSLPPLINPHVHNTQTEEEMLYPADKDDRN